MAMSWVHTGSNTLEGTTSVTPDIYASITGGELGIMFVYCKPDTATIDTPSGWTRIAECDNASANGEAQGFTTGDTRVAAFYRVHESGDTAPTVTATGSNIIQARIFTHTSTFGGANVAWHVSGTSGSDDTDGTAVSITGDSIPDLRAQASVWTFHGKPRTFGNQTSPTLTATGATFTSQTNVGQANGSINSYELRSQWHRWRCDSGPASAAPVWGWTSDQSAQQYGGGLLVTFIDGVKPGHVTASATANSPTAQLKPNAGTVTATATANSPTVDSKTNSGAVAASATANSPVPHVGANAVQYVRG